ncbi:unnamed protein product, partial [Mesorhabditis belari]|uniref:Uncharacterized protein n=1 Tax=Mesorhabditis belari TaxID=2138241 RepID=A0AAF3J5W5_9BILA
MKANFIILILVNLFNVYTSVLHCPLGLSTDGETPMNTVDTCACCYKEAVQMTSSVSVLYNCLQEKDCDSILKKRENTVCSKKTKKFEVFGKEITRDTEECYSKNEKFH